MEEELTIVKWCKDLCKCGFPLKNVYSIKMGNDKETITVLITISANGEMVPPMIIYPYVRVPKTFQNAVPNGWFLSTTDSGWMRTETFFEHIANHFHFWVESKNIKRPIILFVDGHRSHLDGELCDFF